MEISLRLVSASDDDLSRLLFEHEHRNKFRDFRDALDDYLSPEKKQRVHRDAPLIKSHTVGRTVPMATSPIPIEHIGQLLTPPFSALIGAWLQARFGRKVRLRVGDLEVEASTISEVEQLLQKATGLRAPNENEDT